MHCTKTPLKFVKNNLQEQNRLLLYKQLQTTWLFVQSVPCYIRSSENLIQKDQRMWSVWSLGQNHMLYKWVWNSPVFVQRGLPAGPAASHRPWCPQTGLSPSEVGHTVGQSKSTKWDFILKMFLIGFWHWRYWQLTFLSAKKTFLNSCLAVIS